MILLDVNVLVYAHREEADDHVRYLAWLERVLIGSEPVGVSDLALSGFLRVVTNPRAFRTPSPFATAHAFASQVRALPACVPVAPGPRHWEIFTLESSTGRPTSCP